MMNTNVEQNIGLRPLLRKEVHAKAHGLLFLKGILAAESNWELAA